ncbi:hypothetical protein GPALN_012053 [Globodera pallida]|nr:hypothetical protein GPALN_012053 [Globodera pallida]
MFKSKMPPAFLTINCYDDYTGPHELLHALGLCHEDQRSDTYNFIKLNPFNKKNSLKTDNYGFAYDFGSIMHYAPQWGSHNTYKRITLNRFYQQTIGQRERPSFKDFAIINSIYCNDTCGAQNVCQNGGYPNPHRCWECFCPDGYGGRHCETLEENFGCISVGVHSPRELEADWQTRTFNPSMKCMRSVCKCHLRIKPKMEKSCEFHSNDWIFGHGVHKCHAGCLFSKSNSERTKGHEVQNFAARTQLPKCPLPKTGLRQKSPAQTLSFLRI